ncbi:M23 family metallopeptidase [Oceanobacillus massiliensis]|uniref:M23 family metallopeptidase n=1 Tax=Oceanobacillus massiliensis TaxID=1465765 RepID=UPI0002881D5C|nr:M23 family metallopeptidase [Oceanobacillus massiliensis]
MDKDIRKIRKSIEQRKKSRGRAPDSTKKQLLSLSPEPEERHGYYPVYTGSGELEGKGSPAARIAVKGILSVMLFFGTALVWQVDSDALQKPKEWTNQALTDEFPFARANMWYKQAFGRPLSLSPNPVAEVDQSQSMALPVNGNITETFDANGTGIMIEPGETSNVSTIKEGVVIFAGNDKETNKTVTVQHADGSVSSYGNLSSIDVHLYQFISASQAVGSFTPSSESEMVYFSIEKNDDYIDPVQVIQVDELP